MSENMEPLIYAKRGSRYVRLRLKREGELSWHEENQRFKERGINLLRLSEKKTTQARMTEIQQLSLKRGGRNPDGSGMCVMEAVAYVAGEPWSDEPQCACPVITKFMVQWNDSLPTNADRDRLLKPLIPIIVGTRSTKTIEERRGYMALDWLIRVFTPEWLDLVQELRAHAKALRNLDKIVDMTSAAAAGIKVLDARDSAMDAGRFVPPSSRPVTKGAAGDAGFYAASYAVRRAANAAEFSAADFAATYAAKLAASEALKPTAEWLQSSAVDLVHRMAAIQENV